MTEQLEFFEISSPCRGLCQTNENGYCLGCYRSRDERFNWLNYSDSQKKEVLRLCLQRYNRLRLKKQSEDNIESQQQELFD